MLNDLLIRLHRSIEAQVPRKVVRDLRNHLRFGSGAPLSDEQIWIDPALVDHAYVRDPVAGVWRRRHSGQVTAGDWDRSLRPLRDMVKHRACVDHFERGLTWEETGIYDEMMRRIAHGKVIDGCRSLADVRARYATIDALYDTIRRDGAFTPMAHHPERLRREHGGIFVHLSRDGTPILGGNGNHRLAIAQILKLPKVPAQVGVVHADLVRAGGFASLRKA